MSDLFYKVVVTICGPAFAVSSSPVVLHRERAARRGPYILAANHLSPYDVPCLMKVSPRPLDFVSTVEVFRKRWVAWFFTHMNAFPLDRGRVDTATTRTIVERLRRGRVVAMFPEGRVRRDEESVIHGGDFKPGVLRLARIAAAPILPCVIVGTGQYRQVASWFPIRATVYGVNFGQIIEPAASEDFDRLDEQLRSAFRSLHEELRAAMAKRPCRRHPAPTSSDSP